MKKRPFQYMVIVHKFEEKDGDSIYKDSEVVINLTTTMAKNEKDLAFRVTREIPEVHAENPENVEIIIRPF